MRFSRSLRARLLLLIALAILPAVAITALTTVDHAKEEEQEFLQTTRQTLLLARAQQEALINDTHLLLAHLAADPRILDADQCRSFLEDTHGVFPRYTTLIFASPEGVIECASIPLNGTVRVADRAYFQGAIATGAFTVGDYQIGRVTGKPTLGFGLPVKDAAGEVVGVVAATLDLDWLQAESRVGALPAGTTLTAFDQEGRLLARYPPGNFTVGQSIAGSELFRHVRAEAEGSARLEGIDGVERTYSFLTLIDSPSGGIVFLVSGTPTSFAYQEVSSLAIRTILSLALILLIATAVVWWAGERFLTRPLLALGAAAQRVSRGDLSARTGVAHNGDEIGRLAAAFDGMAASLESSEKARREQEAELQRSATKFRVAAEIGSDLMYEWDVKGGTLEWRGDIDARLGYPPGAFPRTLEAWEGIIHPEDRPRVMRELEAALAQGDTFESEYRVVARDGEVRHWTDKARIMRDADGSARTWIGITSDITPRVLAQEALRASEERYRLVVEGAREYAIYALDTEGRITSWNSGAQRLKGYTADEAIGRHFSMFFKPEDVAAGRPQAILRDAIERGSHEDEGERVRKDGSRFFVNAVVTPLYGRDGRHVGFVKITRDVTEKRRAQEAEAARLAAEATARAKGEFLANMSHEIRTPLNAVIGMSSLLIDSGLSAEQREMALIARTSGEHLLGLINDILDFSKIEAGRMDIEHQDVDVRLLVEQSLDVVAMTAAAKRIELVGDVADDVPRLVTTDGARLRQVLVNLLANGVKFTERGEVSVDVGAEREDDALLLHFRVSDTGVGIPARRLQSLFTPFTQADASTSRVYGGTGLGLAISKRLVEAMGGRIWAESEVGRGSTFHFTIRAPSSSAAVAPNVPPTLLGRQVLVVDDNATNRRVLSHQLVSWGMRPTAFAGAIEALDRVRSGARFDVAILDHNLGEMDGVTLAVELARLSPATPLILLSSLSAPSADAAERGAPFAAVLTKPAKSSHLFDAIANALAAPSSLVAPGAPPASAQAGPMRILLVEDNAVNQRVALLMLKTLGYTADTATNGGEALARVQEAAYDVVLMDLQMPHMDGVEATRRIRSELPPDRQPRIVALTAHALETERERAMAAGMDDYLTKPLDRGALAAALERARSAQGARE